MIKKAAQSQCNDIINTVKNISSYKYKYFVLQIYQKDKTSFYLYTKENL